MTDPFYRTNVETMHRLNLLGAEAQVYSALLFLCSKGPYKGSYQELAYFSCCGVDETASRAVKRLIKKGIIVKDTNGISIPQIVGNQPQIVGEKPQNAAISKEEKENQKKKENIKERMSVRNIDSHAPTLVFDPNKVFEPPYWNEWEAFGKAQGIEQIVYKKAWCYYMMRGWEGVREWKAALLYWDLKNKT